MSDHEFGILYVATGGKYREECLKSAKSAKKVMPDVPIALWTDTDEDLDINIFDSINICSNPKYSFFDKIAPLLETTYSKTLFLDTDTYLIESVYEIFDLLDNFDLAFAHAPNRMPAWGKNFHALEGIPSCFPQPNTGVIAYRKSAFVMRFIQSWERIYEEQMESDNPPGHDQVACLKALYHSELRFMVLTPEYNLRTTQPVFRGGRSRAKILHGRGLPLERAIREINVDDIGVKIFDFRKSNELNG